MRIGGAGSVSPLVSNTGTVVSADDSELRAHVEPVDWGCIADEIASSEDLDLLTMPVIAQDGAVWAGDLRYVGTVTDQLNGDGYCSEHFGFSPHDWATGLSGGFNFATLSLQVNSTTDPLSRVPVYHTRMLMNWGALPRNGESAKTVRTPMFGWLLDALPSSVHRAKWPCALENIFLMCFC